MGKKIRFFCAQYTYVEDLRGIAVASGGFGGMKGRLGLPARLGIPKGFPETGTDCCGITLDERDVYEQHCGTGSFVARGK